MCARQHQVAEVKLATDSRGPLIGCFVCVWGGGGGAPHQYPGVTENEVGKRGTELSWPVKISGHKKRCQN